MKRTKRILILLMSLALTTSCGEPNLLTEFSQTDSDEALYFEAKKQIDNLQWDTAIDIIENQMGSAYAARVDVKETLAGAYAGKCGFTFIDIVTGLSNSPSANLFPFFMSIFAGQTLTPSACDQAISIISSLGNASQRSQDQNLFLTILGIARIGTTLGAKLDPTADGVADGVYSTDYNVCHNYSGGAATDGYGLPLPAPQPPAEPARSITDAEAKRVASGIGMIFENMAALGSVLSGDNATLTSLQETLTDCEAIAGVGNCTATSVDAVSPELLYVIRVLLDVNGMGFGTCVIGDTYPAATACCPALKPPGI